jgi:hypothetical protein
MLKVILFKNTTKVKFQFFKIIIFLPPEFKDTKNLHSTNLSKLKVGVYLWQCDYNILINNFR